MKLKDIVSGKEVNVSPKVFQSRAVKYGVDAEVLKNSYVSRESKSLLRSGKTVDEIRQASGVTGLPAVDQAVIDKITAKKVYKKVVKADTATTAVDTAPAS